MCVVHEQEEQEQQESDYSSEEEELDDDEEEKEDIHEDIISSRSADDYTDLDSRPNRSSVSHRYENEVIKSPKDLWHEREMNSQGNHTEVKATFFDGRKVGICNKY